MALRIACSGTMKSPKIIFSLGFGLGLVLGFGLIPEAFVAKAWNCLMPIGEFHSLGFGLMVCAFSA